MPPPISSLRWGRELAPRVRQRQKRHRGEAGGALPLGVEQRVEGAPVRLAGEQLVAVGQVAQRHGFAAERVDHMPVVDNVARAARARRSVAFARAPVRRGGAEARLGGRLLRRVVVSKVHAKPRLMIGDVSARHRIPSLERRDTLARDRHDRPRAFGPAPLAWFILTVAGQFEVEPDAGVV